jgi:hypothetical protein
MHAKKAANDDDVVVWEQARIRGEVTVNHQPNFSTTGPGRPVLLAQTLVTRDRVSSS